MPAYTVQDVPDGRFQGLKGGVGFWPKPFVFDFAPQGFDFVEMGDVGGQVEDVDVLDLPRLKPRLEGSGVVDFGVVEHEHRGAGASGRPRVKRIDDEGRVQGAFTDSGV